MRNNLKGIVFINQTLGMGGAENFNSQLLAWFSKHGVPVKAWTAISPFIRELKGKGIETHKIPLIIDVIGDWKGLIKGMVLLPAGIIYYTHLTWVNRDNGTILMSGFIEKILVTPVAKLLNIPVVWIEFGPLETIFNKFFGFPKFLYRLVSKLPDYVIEPSENTKNSNRKIAGFISSKIKVIPCGIAPLKKYSMKQKELTAYCVSRMEKGKGQDLLILAWLTVLKKYPKAKLYLIGTGDFVSNLKNIVEGLNLKKSVIFLGKVKDLAKIISPFSLGVFPSIWPLEGFGLVLLETMSLGKPVICFRHGPYPEIVNRKCAILVKEYDTYSLSDAIVKIFSKPNLAKNMGIEGKKRFERLYSLEKVGPQFEDVLLGVQIKHCIEKSSNISKWHVYSYDLKNKGIKKFITDRLKKYKATRRLFYFFYKSYVMLGNRKLYINKMDTVVSAALLRTGKWEPRETQIFLKYVKQSNLVVDIGANIGYYTLSAVNELTKGGKVVSFEPENNNFALLKKTVKENKIDNVTLVDKAVSNHQKSGFVYLNSDNYGDQRTYKSLEKREKQKIEFITLDKYFHNSNDKIDLLKIDIQGAELKALRGAHNLLKQKRIKVILSELWPMGMEMAGDKWGNYIKYFRSNGFRLFQIDDSIDKLAPLSEEYIYEMFKNDNTYTTNILAILKQ